MTRPSCVPRGSSVLLLALAQTLTACSAPPKAPTVDDSTRRPLNDPRAVQLQQCRAELSATAIALQELSLRRPSPGALREQHFTPPATSPTPSGHRVFVLGFEAGHTDFVPPPDRDTTLRNALRDAALVVIRGRADENDPPARARPVARLRAESASRYAAEAGVPPERLRIIWESEHSADTTRGPVARRVEIEIYPVMPEQELLGVADQG